MMIASRHGNFPVKKGDKIAGTRIIPLVIEKKKWKAARQAAGEEPIFQILPYRYKTAGVVTTGSEVLKNRISDTFTPVIEEKLAEYQVQMTEHVLSGDDHVVITKAIEEMIEKGVEWLSAQEA